MFLYAMITVALANALMQFPNASSDLLIFAPSFSLIPRLVVTNARSDPAKSINSIFPLVIVAEKSADRGLCSTMTWDEYCISRSNQT